jgi:hypothetical protein
MALELKTTKNSKLPKLSENCFEPVGKGGWPLRSIWISYYRDIPLLQAQVKRLATRNALLEQENFDLKAHTERESKRSKKSENIIIKNTTSFKAIINFELKDPSFTNF